MRLTLGWTFTSSSSLLGSLVAVDDSAARQVVGRELHDDLVLGEDPDVVLTHLAADVRQDLVPVLELHPEHRVGQGFDDPALDLDGAVLLRHVLRILLDVRCRPRHGGAAGAATRPQGTGSALEHRTDTRARGDRHDTRTSCQVYAWRVDPLATGGPRRPG